MIALRNLYSNLCGFLVYMKYTLLLVLGLLSTCVRAQENKVITLRNERVNYTPAYFHIIAIIDDRPDVNNIGSISPGFSNKEIYLDLKDGVSTAISRFIQTNVPQRKNNTPVSLHLSALKATTKSEGIKNRVDVTLLLAFYADDKKLVEYTCSTSQEYTKDATPYIEELIRKTLISGITQFDKWWGANSYKYAIHPLKVNVVVAKMADDDNKIVYAKSKPLSLNDFQGQPDEGSKGIAATYSGIYVRYTAQTINGNTVLNVTITPCFLKDKSWCKAEGRNPYALAHEQIHFDITAFKACELAATISSYRLTNDNYSAALENLRKQNQESWEKMQDDYDVETEHGTIETVQNKWSVKVKQLLAGTNCY